MPGPSGPLTLQRLMPFLLILVSACDRPHPGEALVASVQQAHRDPAAAAAACRGLPPKAAGECLALLAGQVAPDDRQTAITLCEGTDDPLWQDECWFLVAEAIAAADGPGAAVETCGRAGRFARNCLGHLWLDAAARAHGAHPAAPQAAWEAYAPTGAWTVPGAEPDALARRHQGTFFDARFNPTGAGGEAPPIDASWCAIFEGARVRSCRQAATESLQRQLNRAAGAGVDLAVLCSEEPLAERVTAATGVRWLPDPALDQRAATLIERSCAPVAPGAPGPLLGSVPRKAPENP